MRLFYRSLPETIYFNITSYEFWYMIVITTFSGCTFYFGCSFLFSLLPTPSFDILDYFVWFGTICNSLIVFNEELRRYRAFNRRAYPWRFER